ncbi:polyprenol reductase 1 isoform X1 [Phoenix dactylifera]|uniref:Polyprenol reductase 1 isoform X1 n=2 Tax=Phoenix dactylifera TaxID=42345 RepID=A0A8B7BKP3_PHODC|nr:polyprenol reductase 1 isoform X1 [Phoenix dactylifera]
MLTGFAARGKTRSSSSKFTVPQRYFLHFYLVAVMLTTCLVVSTWFYAYRKMLPLSSESLHYSTIASHLTGGSHVFSIHKVPAASVEHKYLVWQTVFVLLLMEAQVLRRLHETLNVFNYSPSARMHIVGYLAGLFFYTMAPLSLGSSCAPEALSYAGDQIAEFIVKGRARMPDLEVDLWKLLMPFIKLGWCQWIGAAIFIWGWLHQLRCHAILGSLRENKGADEYVIPHGDWFEYVSCPHYLAEIVIYAGILVAAGGLNITVWLLFLFVVSNLVFAAAETHRWYRHKFESYPQSRHAIIPFIY